MAKAGAERVDSESFSDFETFADVFPLGTENAQVVERTDLVGEDKGTDAVFTRLLAHQIVWMCSEGGVYSLQTIQILIELIKL